MKARSKSIPVSGRAQAPAKIFGGGGGGGGGVEGEVNLGVDDGYRKSQIFLPARLGLRSPSSNAIISLEPMILNHIKLHGIIYSTLN